jgi:hypothetical protein
MVEAASARSNWRSILAWFCLIIGTLLLLGCGGSDAGDDLNNFFRDPNTEPARATIKTAVPLAHVAAGSMAAVQGNPPRRMWVRAICICTATHSAVSTFSLISSAMEGCRPFRQ